MKLSSGWTDDGRRVFGRLNADGRIDPFDSAHSAMDLLFLGRPVDIARVAAPVDVSNIFCIGRNYAKHAQETGSAVPEAPMIFMKPTTAILEPDGVIRIPPQATAEVDFEAEMAVVIGKVARNITESESKDHVLGFTCANDISARDCQRSDKQWARAKGFDTFCPLGPWIVTPDEFGEAPRAIRSRLNDRVMQEASLGEMIHPWRKLVSYLSRQFTLLPGTVILTGTPEGVGMARNPPVFLQPGDKIEVEIEGIGTLSNKVAALQSLR